MSYLEEMTLPEGLAPADEVYSRAFLEGLTPDPDLLIWEWADKNRVLPKETTAEWGQWRTERTPLLREIMEALSPSDPVQEVVLAKGTQLGGTEVGNNFIGYIIDVAPAPVMMVLPTTGTGKRSSKTRVDKMISSTPALQAKVAQKRSRDAANSASLKEFKNGVLIIASASSASELSSSPVRFLFLDELDSYLDDVGGEGPPEQLAEKRTDTFVRRKIFKNSSVKGAKNHSKIMKAFRRGDQRRAYVPCPHCDHEQVLVWPQMRWDTRRVHELRCAECAAISAVEDPHLAEHECGHCGHVNPAAAVVERDTGEVVSVHYECIGCKAAIDEHHKGTMFARGRWIAQAPGVGKPKSYHLSSLYSPLGWYSWLQAARDYVLAEADATGKKMRAFENTVLAEEYSEAEIELVPQTIATRAERYKQRTVPWGGLMLSASADVQKNRLEVVVKAWGRGEESWLIAHEVIFGDPLQDDVWASLDDFLRLQFTHESGQKMGILATAIDSGYLAQRVYNFTMTRQQRCIFAVKGMEQSGKTVLGRPTTVDVDYRGQTIKGGTQVWPIGTDTAKTEIMKRLEIVEPGPQYMHFPKGLPDEYYQQLTAEVQVRKFVRGRQRLVWQLEQGRRNEALDCEVYAYAAAIYAGLHRADWDQLEAFFRQTRDLFVEAEKREELAAAAAREEAESQAAQDTDVAVEEPPAEQQAVPAAPDVSRETVAAPPRETWIERRPNWLR